MSVYDVLPNVRTLVLQSADDTDESKSESSEAFKTEGRSPHLRCLF